MNTENTDWIPMSERRPTEADYPIWGFFDYNGGNVLWVGAENLDSRLTHWQSCKRPPPPPKQRTQREEDEAEAKRWVSVRENPFPNIMVSARPAEAFMAGIAYRDAQNRKDLETVFPRTGYTDGTPRIKAAIAGLLKRAGL